MPVDLNRRFHELNDKELPDPEMRRALGLDDGGLGWPELLRKRRAVVLAEAGSGKSTEFAERAKLSAESNPYVFHASVEDVGREGLDSALLVDARGRLGAWREGVDDAWFFIDSIDEAKVVGIRFEQVTRKLAESVHGAEERCHIFFSGRVTDWEPQRDVEALKKWLPASSLISQVAATPEDELLRILRNERKLRTDTPLNEAPFIAVMAPLDDERIRLFAKAKGVPGAEEFLQAINDSNLWHFARMPLDLDWLVRFWQTEERLGTLKEMVGRSITARLKETNVDRSRQDDLIGIAALSAVERLGSTMVFARQTTIAIPDRETKLVSDESLDLAEVLPDWSGDDRIRLLTRPIFDPATLGRVRFHNDNDGTVRSFLAARWLVRMREANLSTSGLFRLLFANSYGLDVIRPSLNETVAWLCLWDRDVANAVVRLSPQLLLSAGDPASLSAQVRSAALAGVLHELTSEEQESPWWDHDKLKRFAQPDLGRAVRTLWAQYRSHRDASELLIRLVWLGAFKECEPLIREVAFDSRADSTVRVLAGRALLEVANASTLHDYAELIKADAKALPVRMLSNALPELFPTQIGPREVLRILADLDIEDDANGLDFKRIGIILAKRLESPADLELFLAGLLGQLDTQIDRHSHNPLTKREEIFFPAIAEAGLRLLKTVPSNSAPDAAIDAILRIFNRREDGEGVGESASEALAELHRTAERRRRALWRIVTTLRTVLGGQSLDQVWHLRFVGYQTSLKIEDIDWLLTDGLAKGGADCRLAVNAAMDIYRSQGERESILARISEIVQSDPVGLEAFCECTAPPMISQAHQEMNRRHHEIESRNRAEESKRHQSWLEFVRDMRTNPDRISRLKQPTSNGQHSDLMDLWQLLQLAGSQSRYAMASVAPLVRITGAEVANAVQAGLIAHWRVCKPLLRSHRKRKERNSVRWIDLMGLTGVTLEATSDPGWATKLSDEEVRRATEFATLEINGFPRWISHLAATRPAEVKAVLHREIKDELTREGVTFFETLHAASSDDELASLLAPVLLNDIEAGDLLPDGALGLVLQIIVNGVATVNEERFARWGIAKFEQEGNLEVAVQYLAALFSVNPVAATPVLLARAAHLNDEDQTVLVDQFLRASFGDSTVGARFRRVAEPPAGIIEKLVLLSFRTHKQVTARQRPAGVVYQLKDTDYADRARGAIFSCFVETPGSATYHTLRRLQHDPSFPLAQSRLRALADQRALKDSEAAPWLPGEAFAFEQSQETAPQTAKDLRAVLVGRIEDIQHDLLNDDFSQGRTLKGLTPEREVQKWVADRLRLKQGRSFSVEREPHVFGEKEPDVRIRANATDACVSMEIKVADSWALTQLDDALEVQLCGQYLRSDKGGYGVLLLVHQKARQKGWQRTADSEYLSFEQVVQRLRERAQMISSQSHDSPQPEVAVLDVSEILL